MSKRAPRMADLEYLGVVSGPTRGSFGDPQLGNGVAVRVLPDGVIRLYMASANPPIILQGDITPELLQGIDPATHQITPTWKSLGSLPKRMVRRWFESRDDAQVFRASVGQSPSLADVIKLAHPKPVTAEREAFLGYLIGTSHDAAKLPKIVRQLESFRRGESIDVPDVPFEMLTSLPLSKGDWKRIFAFDE